MLFEERKRAFETNNQCVFSLPISDMAMQLCNRRVTQVTTNLVRQLAKPVPMKVKDEEDHEDHDDHHIHIAVPKTPTPKTIVSMNKQLLRRNVSIATGLTCKNYPIPCTLSMMNSSPLPHLAALSIRHAHTDIQVPSFDYYRRKSRLDPSKSYRDAGDATSPYSYLTPLGKSTKNNTHAGRLTSYLYFEIH